MTQPESIIPPQPGWWVRNGRAGTMTATYGWDGYFSGDIPLVYGSKRSILMPNPKSHVYPLLMPLRQAMSGGKILTRPKADEYGDSGIGARTRIYIPNPANRAYPILRPFRLGKPALLNSLAQVTYDATGVSGISSGGTSWSYVHTISGNAIAMAIVANTNSSAPILTASVGATPMVLQSIHTATNISGTYLALFGLLNPPQGAQTISLMSNISSNTTANSVSYNGATGFGSVSAVDGTGTSLSQTVSAASYQMIFQMFSTNQFATLITAYNQNVRSNISGGAAHGAAVIGDSTGSATSFTATDTSASGWCGMSMAIL